MSFERFNIFRILFYLFLVLIFLKRQFRRLKVRKKQIKDKVDIRYSLYKLVKDIYTYYFSN